MVLTYILKLFLWRNTFKYAYYIQSDKDEDDSRFLVGNDTNQKTVKQCLKSTKRKPINLEFYTQWNYSSEMEVK